MKDFPGWAVLQLSDPTFAGAAELRRKISWAPKILEVVFLFRPIPIYWFVSGHAHGFRKESSYGANLGPPTSGLRGIWSIRFIYSCCSLYICVSDARRISVSLYIYIGDTLRYISSTFSSKYSSCWVATQSLLQVKGLHFSGSSLGQTV